MAKLDRRTIEYIIAAGGAIDLLLEGKFSTPVVRALKKAAKERLWPAAKPVGRGLSRLALAGGAAVAPVALPAYGGYLGAEMARRQYEQAGLEAFRDVPLGYPVLPTVAEELGVLGTPLSPTIDVLTPAEKVKGKVSTYARNVGKVMKAVKKSKTGGKPGYLSNPKKTFATVSKTVSKRMKGQKVGLRGIGGITRRIVKKVKPKRKKTRRTTSLGRRY